MTATTWTAEEWAKVGTLVIEQAKAEIRADIAAGRVPETVSSFAALHDHVDANEYGGAFDSWSDDEAGRDEFCAFGNRVQGEVDQWLKAGRP